MPTIESVNRRGGLGIENRNVDRFRELGFNAVNQPLGQPPQLPGRISDLAPTVLGDLQITYAAWREYTEDLHAEALTVYTASRSAYDYQVAVISNTLTDTRTVKDKVTQVAVNPKVREKQVKMLDDEMMLNLLASKLTSYTNVLQVLSRELTRRGMMV